MSNVKYKTGAAECAAAIREELRTKFPGVKFSVKSSTYSMGDSVDIGWTDGPTSKEVDEVTGRYQYGSFNSMEDMYENTNSIEGLPQAKYVMTSRDMSAETRAALMPKATEIFDAWKDESGRAGSIWDAGNLLYRVFSKCSIPVGATVTGVERAAETCGQVEELYTISYTVPESANIKPVEVEAGKIQVIEYSEKAIAVIGDTYSIRQKLGELGGRFNKFLSCGPGWIFPKTKLTQLQTALTSL